MFNSRLRTPESFNAEYIFKSSRGFIESGRYTRRSFIGYRDLLSRFIEQRCPGGVYWIGGGLLPRGVVPSTVDEFAGIPVKIESADNAAEIIGQAESVVNRVDPVKVKKFITQKDVWEQMVRESTGCETGNNGYSSLRKKLAGIQ
jgi:hypothetical protein